MSDPIATSEPLIRMGAFAGVLAVLALGELLAPRRVLGAGRRVRWPNNLGILLLDSALARLVAPAAAVGAALTAEAQGWGLLNLLGLPGWLSFLVALVALDLAIYAQHVAFHAVPLLWRLHRVHHADTDLDVTTGLRFHPIEILLSLGIKAAAVVALGAPAAAVLAFEVILNATSMFSHANLRLPGALDRVLRRVVVTPDMHRVHHSVLREETDRNFGFNLSCWDRLFGTYRDQPAAGHDGMTVGIEDFRDPRELWIDRLLLQPFRTPRRPAAPTAPSQPSRT